MKNLIWNCFTIKYKFINFKLQIAYNQNHRFSTTTANSLKFRSFQRSFHVLYIPYSIVRIPTKQKNGLNHHATVTVSINEISQLIEYVYKINGLPKHGSTLRDHSDLPLTPSRRASPPRSLFNLLVQIAMIKTNSAYDVHVKGNKFIVCLFRRTLIER